MKPIFLHRTTGQKPTRINPERIVIYDITGNKNGKPAFVKLDTGDLLYVDETVEEIDEMLGAFDRGRPVPPEKMVKTS